MLCMMIVDENDSTLLMKWRCVYEVVFRHSALSVIWFCAYYFDICLEIAAAAFAMSLTAVAAPEMICFHDFRHHGCYSFVLIFKRVTMVMPMMRRWRQRVGLRCFTSRRISRLHVLRGVDDCNVCCEVVWWCSCETCFSCWCCVQYCDAFLANAFMWSCGCVMIAMLLPRFAVDFWFLNLWGVATFFCLKVVAWLLLFVLLLLVRCEGVLNILRLLTELRWFGWRVFAFCVGLFEVGVRFGWCNYNWISVLKFAACSHRPLCSANDLKIHK